MPNPNRLNRDQFRADLSDANYAARRAGLPAFAWAIIVVVALFAIGGLIFGLSVAFSGPKGAGDQIRITNDGRNRVNSQEWFASQYQQIRSTDRRIDEAAAALAKTPDGDFEKTNYTGLVNRCMEMVGAYNAEATKVSRGKWRDETMPFQIDESDTATDCKESK